MTNWVAGDQKEALWITFVISSLNCGGAERVLSTMANWWAEQGEEVTILTLAPKEAPFYPLHPAVKHRPLGLAGESRNLAVGFLRNLYRVRVLRRAIRETKSQVVISFVDRTNVLTILATCGLGLPVIVSERINPAQYDIGMLWSWLRRRTYPWANALVCQTSAAAEFFTSFLGEEVRVIPNPVLVPPKAKIEHTVASSADNRHRIVAVGRLTPQKGFDMLLQAFNRVTSRHPDWTLTILGEGPARTELERKASSLGLSGKVDFLGQVPDPFPILRQADLFVLSSRFEGFPNTLCEAMACGLPVISFDCPSGPREIIRHEVDGVLIPPEDVDALAAALDRLMGDAGERERLAKRAPEVLDRFSVEKVMEMWNRLIEEVTG